MPGGSSVCGLFLALVSSFYVAVDNAASAAAEDPCINHQLIVGMPERSMEAELLPFDKPLCDKALVPEAAWYRVVHEQDGERAGEDMPSWPPGVNHCGTVYPIWINGTLPQKLGEIVDRIACSDGGTVKSKSQDRCFDQRTVKIKHCDGYNVYWLPRVSSCPHAYCFGEVPCPPGWTSPTGFEPQCRVSDFIDTPIVSWSVTGSSEKSLNFLCNLPTRPLERDLLFNITWSLTYRSALGTQVSASLHGIDGAHIDQLPLVLPEEKLPRDFRFNALISCAILPWTMDGRVGNRKSSQPFFAGIDVSPKYITLFEGERQTIELNATVPIICRSANTSTTVASNVCTVALAAYISPSSCTPFSKGLPENNLLIEGLSCGATLTGRLADDSTDGRLATNVNVMATVDGKFGWSQETVSKKINFKTVSLVTQAWHGLELSEIEVKILDRDRFAPSAMCYSNDDPHMQTFDKRPFEMHQQGSFILYRNTIFDVEVQSFYQVCTPNSRVTCNCAVAVRSGWAVFVLDACYKIRTSTRARGQFFRVGIVGCTDGGMTVSQSGSSYEVKLPTGAAVRIGYNHNGPYSVTIVPGSQFDRNSTEGLCGLFNGSPTDDFRLRDGSTLLDYSPDFAKSWRVTASDSLFARLPTFGSIKGEAQSAPSPTNGGTVQYCNCDAARHQTSQSIHAYAQLDCIRAHAIAGNSCPSRDEVTRTCHVKDIAKKGDLLFELFEYFDDSSETDDQIHDWRNGWTEQKATSHCREYLLSNSALKPCLTVPNVNLDKAVKQCVLDIKLLGTTEYQFVALELIVAECRAEAERNVTIWVPSPINGNLELPIWVVDGLCPANCSNRGTCDSGACKCWHPYYGTDCSADETTPPTLVESIGRCDESANVTSCISGIRVYGRGFSTRRASLVCQFELDEMSGGASSTSLAYQSNGTVESMGELACSLPSAVRPAIYERRLPKLYNISVSNDGKTFSNKVSVLIYDSRCHSCQDGTRTCYPQINVCIIDKVCYTSGSFHPDGRGRKCLPTTSTSEWTTPAEIMVPQVTQPPLVEWRVVEKKQQHTTAVAELAFTCDLDHPYEPLLAFDVAWITETLEGRVALRKVIYTVQNISKSQFPLLLRQSDCGPDFKFGVKIYCEIRPYYTTSKLKGEAVSSQPLFAGIEASPKQISLLEGEEQVIQLRATVPILCNLNTSVSDCKVAVVASIFPSCQPTAVRGLAENNVLIDGPECGAIIGGSVNSSNLNGNLTATIKVIATVDGKFGWANEEIIKQIKFQTTASSDVTWGWHGLELPDVQVKIIDRDRSLPSGMCYSNDDPHMQTFDRRPYEMHEQGSFILYRNQLLDVEVQSFYQPCLTNSWVTCNCAVAVRSGVDVFILDACDKIRSLTKARGRFYRAGIVGCTGRGMMVSSAGNNYEILLSTGAVVRIWFSSNGPYSVSIVPGSWFDRNATEGLCGLFSSNHFDDFRLRNGTIQPDYTSDFANDWRIPVHESIFVTLASYGNARESQQRETWGHTSPQQYCNCDSMRPLTPRVFGDFANLTCVKADAVAGRDCPFRPQKEQYCNVRDTAKIGDILFESFDFIYDSGKKHDQVPVWKNGWSEQKARTHCQVSLLSNSAVKSCMFVANVNVGRAIEQCVLDIKLVGTTEYEHVALQQVISECKAEAERNVSMWDPKRGNSTLGLPDWLVDSLCPANCTGRGACDKGACICLEHYYGADCSSDERIPPILHESIGLCDESSNITSCRGRIPVYGSGFSTIRTSLTCKFEVTEVSAAVSVARSVEYTVASVDGIGQASCIFPQSLTDSIKEKRLPIRYNVSLSNDGKSFSNKVIVLVYDSSCHICRSAADGCISKPDVCIIEGVCYASNSTHPVKTGQVCEPKTSTTDWTTLEEARLPVVSQLPVVEWRLLGDGAAARELWFICSHNHSREHLLAFDVTWKTETMGRAPMLSRTLPTMHNVSQDAFPLLLRQSDFGADFKFGVKVFCEIVPYYRTSMLKGNALTSRPFVAGIEVVPTTITMTEGETAFITLTPTVPITCMPNVSAGKCVARVSLVVGTGGGATSSIKDQQCNAASASVGVLVDNSVCGVAIHGIGSDANTTWSPRASSVRISSTVDGKFGFSDRTTRVISFQTALTGIATAAWEGVTLPDVHVTILDGDRKISQGLCFSNDDPYMRTFDQKTYHMHLQGPFVLYKHRVHPVEVQAFYQACPLRSGATCNCGVAVRSGTEVFLYDSCTKIRTTTGQKGRFIRVGVVGCGAENMQVVSSASSFEVITSTLTRVTISYNQGGPYSINIASSLLDFNATDGLCGVYNGHPSDDFRHPNGRIYLNYDEQFALGWRLPFQDSLFAQLPVFGESRSNSSQAPPDDQLIQCACEGDVFNQTDSSIVCTKTAIAKKTCFLSSASSSVKVPRYCNRGSTSPSKELIFEDFDYDYDGSSKPKPIPGWSNGWSEQSARAHCTVYIRNSMANSGCTSRPGVSSDIGIEQCIEGIRLTGSTTFDFTALEQVRRDCIADIERNSSLVNGTSSAQEANLCPSDCNSNGRCLKGSCVCHAYYVESDCSLDLRVPPNLEVAEPPCDLRRDPCTRLRVFGSGVSSQASNLTCRLEVASVGEASNVASPAVYTKGIFATYGELSCETPERLRNSSAPLILNIGVSHDGIHFGSSVCAVIYDSTCHVCNASAMNCSIKVSMCYIGGVCYIDGARKSHNSSLACRSQTSQTDWTYNANAEWPSTVHPVTTTEPVQTPQPTCGVCHVSGTQYFPSKRSDCRMFSAHNNASLVRIICPPRMRFSIDYCRCTADEQVTCSC